MGQMVAAGITANGGWEAAISTSDPVHDAPGHSNPIQHAQISDGHTHSIPHRPDVMVSVPVNLDSLPYSKMHSRVLRSDTPGM